MAELLKRLQEAGDDEHDGKNIEDTEKLPVKFPVTDEVADEVAREIGVSFDNINKQEFMAGLEVEQEHVDVTKGSKVLTGKIALAHLKEKPNYYTMLKKMETGKEAPAKEPEVAKEEPPIEVDIADVEPVAEAVSPSLQKWADDYVMSEGASDSELFDLAHELLGMAKKNPQLQAMGPVKKLIQYSKKEHDWDAGDVVDILNAVSDSLVKAKLVVGKYLTTDGTLELEDESVKECVKVQAEMCTDKTFEQKVDEVAPPGWEPTVKAMKKHKEITNPWALAWYMKGKGYQPKKHKSVKEANTPVGDMYDILNNLDGATYVEHEGDNSIRVDFDNGGSIWFEEYPEETGGRSIHGNAGEYNAAVKEIAKSNGFTRIQLEEAKVSGEISAVEAKELLEKFELVRFLDPCILSEKEEEFVKTFYEGLLTEEYKGFKKLTAELSKKKGIKTPKALAAYIGRKKYGKEAFQKKSAAGRAKAKKG